MALAAFAAVVAVDCVAALGSVDLWMSLGARFGARIDAARALAAGARAIAPAVVVVVVAGWLIVRARRSAP